MKTPVYLDYNATTPVDPRVLEAMLPYFTDNFGNPASRHHSVGRDAARVVDDSRRQVAEVIGADPREIIFTSGATESNNLAISGVATSPIYAQRGNHIVTVMTEHKAVLDTCRNLQQRGYDLTYLPVDSYGCLDLALLERAITPKTILVSIMHANNEIGVIHPIENMGRICKDHGVLFHTDATQSLGREPIDVQASGIDLLSLSSHKIYGPKGVGALYVRRRRPRVRCEPQIHGGGHERGMRSGTLNVPGIVGLGAAADVCQREMATEQERLRRLRDRLQHGLMSKLSNVHLNGAADHRLANTLNVSFAGVESETLMQAVPEVAVSSSAACTSASVRPSYVLGAMGAEEKVIRSSIRFSLGRFTTEEEISFAVERFVAAVARLRQRRGADQPSSCSCTTDPESASGRPSRSD